MNDAGNCAVGFQEEPKPLAGTSVHLVDHYLPVTENWMYRRLEGLTRYPPVVLASKLINGTDYPLKRIRCLGPYPRWQRGLNRLTRWPFLYLNAYYRELIEAKPTIVHSHFAGCAVNLRAIRTLARERFRCPTVCSFYGYDLRGLIPGHKWPGYEQLLTEEAAFIVQGPRMAEHLIALGCKPSKVYINPLGIDLRRFPERVTSYRGGTLRVLTVGRFVEKKGIPDAVRAVALAQRKGLDISLTIVGDGELRPELEASIAAEGVADFVKLLGTVDYSSLCQLYYSHDICLQPSVTAANGDTEGGANMCIIEAMAAGLPVVATRHADTPATVAEGENGFLVDEHRPDQLSTAIIELARDTSLWNSFSKDGRSRACRLFDARSQAAELESIYDQILVNHKLL
jgi:colanic acid/amylovoran biosynthesis glycosyltransferase